MGTFYLALAVTGTGLILGVYVYFIV